MTAAVADLDAPAVVAAKVARVQEQIDRWALVSILLGLAFTMVNVQQFAAAGAASWSLGWSAAWLLDPMVSILLLVVVRAEQVTARWQVRMAWQVGAAKWAAFIATYVMNTWTSWQTLTWSAIVLHSVPPIFVLMGAEVLPALREGLTQAVLKAHSYAQASASTIGHATHGLGPAPGPAADAEAPAATTIAVSTALTDVADSPAASDVAAEDIAGVPDGAAEPAAAVRTDEQSGSKGGSGVAEGLPEDRLSKDRLPAAGSPEWSRVTTSATEATPATTDVDPASLLMGGSDTSPFDVPLPFDPPVTSAPDPTDRSGATGESADDEVDTSTGEGADARVALLVELLRADPDMAGPAAVKALEVAGLGPMSERTARRLLGKARGALIETDASTGPSTDDPSTTASAAAEATECSQTGTDHGRPSGLALVPSSPRPSTSGEST